MNTGKLEFMPEGVVIMCPNCKVCSIAISDKEYEAMTTGQQMVEVCQVCGKEVLINV